jgi:hypothetical protein
MPESDRCVPAVEEPTDLPSAENVVKITVGQIEAIRAELAKVPPKPVVRAELSTKMAAVASLAPELLALRRNGWGLEALVAFLADGGLHLTRGTLKNYLQRAGATRSKRRRRKESASAPPAPPSPPLASIAAKPQSPRPTPPVVAGPVVDEQPVPAWSFKVREDTEL